MKKQKRCSCCYYYSWRQFDTDTCRIVRILKKRLRCKKFSKIYDGVFGPPRGGLPLAVKLSHLLEIPLLEKPNPQTLIVDDIADTGKTLEQYAKNGYVVISLFYHSQSSFVPVFWAREKKDKYIIFPWEKKQCAKTKVNSPRS